ncbi:MAG: HNH endonuclease [Bacteroides sp.]|nr:HNH endonuclease [Bacteroides sp.]
MSDITKDYKDYKFNRVHEFASIVSDGVNRDLENGYWMYGYDETQFMTAATRFSKISLLHIYTCAYLLGYYNELFHDNGDDMYEDDEIERWKKIAKAYGLSFKGVKKGKEREALFERWYKKNRETFEKLFQYIADEVVFFLFQDFGFLLKFNDLNAKLISNTEGQRDWDIPQKFLKKDGTLKRCYIPEWVKKAVFHREHGRCVFCEHDLTGVYSKKGKVNYDHIIPLKQYGVNDPCNIQLTCEHCNKSKKDKVHNPQYHYESWW